MKRTPHPRFIDLHSGTHYWRSNQKLPSGVALCPERAEIVVIGAGITGALISHYLTTHGFEVLILDRGEVAQGSTRASTAIVSYELDASLIDLRKKIGPARANYAYRACGEAVERLEKICTDLKCPELYQRRPSLYLASSEADAESFKTEESARREIGLDVELLSAPVLESRFGFKAPQALYSPLAATIDPVSLSHQLIRAALNQGAGLIQKTEVMQIEPRGECSVLNLSSKHTIIARKVIVATGYLGQGWLPKKVASLHSTYAMTTNVLPETVRWPEGVSVWESARPYFYLRPTLDGRAMCGGWDHPFRNEWLRDLLMPVGKHKLLRRLAEFFPGTRLRADYSWCGTFGETEDTLPYLGAYPGLPGVFFALAFGGNGITFAVLAGEMVVDWLNKIDNHQRRIFGFERNS